MVRQAAFVVIVGLFASLAVAFQIDDGEPSFDYLGGAKRLHASVPKVELSEEEMEKIYSGGYAVRMLEGREGLKVGWLRFFADCDPVTAWYIVTDVEHFALEDPSYPATGPIGRKRHTFMPYTIESIPCKVDGRHYAYQLLLMPFVAPRKYCILRHHDRNGFPWESAWELADELYCANKRDHRFDAEFGKAVRMKCNTGAYLVAPLPEGFRRKPSDLYRADITYFVDADPGGDISKLKPLLNLAQKMALPEVVKLVNFHAKRWKEHMEKYHSPRELREYMNLRQRYIELYRERFGAHDADD